LEKICYIFYKISIFNNVLIIIRHFLFQWQLLIFILFQLRHQIIRIVDLRIQENHWVAHYSQILNNRHIFVVEFSHYGFDIILAFYINFKLLVKSVNSHGFYLKYNFLFSIFEVIELNIVNWRIGKLFN